MEVSSYINVYKLHQHAVVETSTLIVALYNRYYKNIEGYWDDSTKIPKTRCSDGIVHANRA